MKRLLLLIAVIIMSGSFTPSFAADIDKLLKDFIRERLPDKDQLIASTTSELRQRLINNLKQKYPNHDKAVDTVLKEVSIEEEVAIGRQITGNLLGAVPLVDDPELQKYVNKVGRWVAEQSERPNLNWHFGVIDSDDLNAFAAPGGYILVTRGLYELLDSEAELAGVLAHEIGHVISKHHLRVLQKSQIVDLGKQIISQKISSNQIVQNLIGKGAEIVARALDKKAEFEADRIAVVLTARAGYDSHGLPEVLHLIGHCSDDDDRVALLFKTHPHPDARLEKLDAAMGTRFDADSGQTLEKRFYKLKPRTPKK